MTFPEVEGINVMNLLARSPYLNPREHNWDILSRRFRQLDALSREPYRFPDSEIADLWAAVFTFNPYLLISINELLISIIHLLISLNIDTTSIFIDINNSFIDINNSFIDINNSFIDINKDGCCIHLY